MNGSIYHARVEPYYAKKMAHDDKVALLDRDEYQDGDRYVAFVVLKDPL
jgi:hypothetical protein